MKNFFSIKEDFVNTRFDRWFKKNICNIPQSLIEKHIRKGNFKVNNKKKKSSYKVQLNDKITINNLNFLPKKQDKIIYKATKKEISNSSGMFLEVNNNYVVINKPAGIAVQSGTKSRRNILDILRETKEFEGSTPFTVHRIDKETTGILIVAKNRKYAQLFTSLFRIRKIHKIYLGIILGEIPKKKGTFIDELIYHEGKKIIKAKAITHYQVIDTSNNYSLIKLEPETGRKHQLRKQLLMHGYPILGDTKYRISTNKFSKKDSLMLHAYKINFSIAGIKHKYQAEPPLAFKNTLKEKYLKNF